MPASKISPESITALSDRLSAVESGLSALTERVASMSVSKPASVSVKGRKQRDPDAPKRAPSAWALLCQELTPRIRALYKSSVGEEKVPQGFPMRVCGMLKERNQTVATTDVQITDAISFLRANPDHKSKTQVTRKASDAASVASAPAAPAPVADDASVASSTKKARKPMSDEAKKAAAEKRKATLAAKKAAAPVVAAPVVAAPAPVVAAVADEDETDEWTKIVIKGKRYLFNPGNNQCYHREADDSQGEWAGLYYPATKTLDTDAEEPVDEEAEDEVDLDEE